MYSKNTNRFIDFIPLIILLIVLLQVQMGCQEKNIETNKSSDTLGLLKFMCPDKTLIKYTKYFGVGCFMIAFCILIYIF